MRRHGLGVGMPKTLVACLCETMIASLPLYCYALHSDFTDNARTTISNYASFCKTVLYHTTLRFPFSCGCSDDLMQIQKSIQTSRSGPRSFYLWHTGGVPQHSRYLQWSRHVSLRFKVTHPHISISICNCAMSASNEKPAMQCVVFTFRSQSSFANLYWSMVLEKSSYLSLASPSGATMSQRPQI